MVLVQRYLRGRYFFAAALALVLCIPGAIVGRYAIPPTYKSTGLVRVAPTIPKILYQNEENQLMPMFDSFVSAQAAFLESPRILQGAVQSEALRSAGWPDGPAGVAALAKALEVKVPRGSQLIDLTVSGRDPARAQAVLNAVLDAYSAVEEDLNGARVERIESALDQRVKDLSAQLSSLRQQTLALSADHGTDDLDAMNAAKVEALVKLDNSIAQLEMQVARSNAAAPPQMGPEPLNPVPDVAALAELSMRDPMLKGLLEQQEHLRIERAAMAAKVGPTHRSMQELQHRIDAVNTEVESRRKDLAEAPVDQLPGGGRPGMSAGAASQLPLVQLRAMLEAQKKLRNAASDELKTLGATRINIRNLRERADEVKRDLDDAKSRLEQMRVERQNTKSGRISVVQRGDLPATPSTDRRLPLTIFGGLAGIGLGIGLIWLYGFLRNGYRFVDDLEHATIAAPILGVIPELAGGRTEEEEQAALSVHHIRNTLQLHAGGGLNGRDGGGQPRAAGGVFTVTSPMAGDGKTHLALALGLSFAMSGRRTLLIDADLVGRGLTIELGLNLAKGLTEAIGAEGLNGEVHSTRPNLWAIPAGASTDFRPEELSSATMDRLLSAARASFDIVIVDSGPIMGSLEANLASPLSDRVVLVVSRGQNPKLVKAALARLRSTGAACAGLVFNRAIPKDFLQSASVISTSKRLPGASKHSRTPATSDLARVMQRGRAEAAPTTPVES